MPRAPSSVLAGCWAGPGTSLRESIGGGVGWYPRLLLHPLAQEMWNRETLKSGTSAPSFPSSSSLSTHSHSSVETYTAPLYTHLHLGPSVYMHTVFTHIPSTHPYLRGERLTLVQGSLPAHTCSAQCLWHRITNGVNALSSHPTPPPPTPRER